MTAPVPAKTGDVVHMFNTLLNCAFYGVVCDEDTPQMMSATLEAVQGDAVLTTPVLVGPKGEPGQNAPIVQLEFIEGLKTFDDAVTMLPDWDETKTNHGVWLVDDADNPTKSLVYIWDGSEWHRVLPGPAGPTGRTPSISIEYRTIPMDERGPGVTDSVEKVGSDDSPHFVINALSPQGPTGPAAAIEEAEDYTAPNGKHVGDALTVLDDGTWGPSKVSLKVPRMFTIPEGAFTNTPNFIGIGPTTFQIGSYVFPGQPYDWIPDCIGKVRVNGLELDADPLRIGCEVRIQTAGSVGDGDLIGKAEGDNGSLALIFPQFSTPGDPNRAVAPGNGVGVIPAGVQTTVTVSLVNQGMASWYSFNRKDAQVRLTVMPADSDFEVEGGS